jgi:hypothetical protein
MLMLPHSLFKEIMKLIFLKRERSRKCSFGGRFGDCFANKRRSACPPVALSNNPDGRNALCLRRGRKCPSNQFWQDDRGGVGMRRSSHCLAIWKSCGRHMGCFLARDVLSAENWIRRWVNCHNWRYLVCLIQKTSRAGREAGCSKKRPHPCLAPLSKKLFNDFSERGTEEILLFWKRLFVCAP